MSFKVRDHYFRKAKQDNYLARSIYKLEEIDKKHSVLNVGDRVVDLGYFPGSWVQYCSRKVGAKGSVVGIDIQGVNKKLLSERNIKLFEKDIFTISELEQIEESEPFDVLLSDMAPKTTGIKSVDQDRSLALVEKVFEIMPLFLRPGGHLVIKVFESNQAQEYLRTQKTQFEEFKFLRPKSTRSTSKEFFVIAKSFKA